MKVKGSAVKSIKEYIEKHHPEKYDEWLEMLPENSREIFTDVILASKYYNLIDAILKPSEIVAILFFEGDSEKAAYEMGVYGGFKALKSYYKIFVKIASLDFVLRRVTSIYSTYYDSGYLKNTYRDSEKAIFEIYGLSKGEELNLWRISGWAYALFSVIDEEPAEVTNRIVKYNDDGSFKGEIIVKW